MHLLGYHFLVSRILFSLHFLGIATKHKKEGWQLARGIISIMDSALANYTLKLGVTRRTAEGLSANIKYLPQTGFCADYQIYKHAGITAC